VPALPDDVLATGSSDLWGHVLRRQGMPLALLSTYPADTAALRRRIERRIEWPTEQATHRPPVRAVRKGEIAAKSQRPLNGPDTGARTLVMCAICRGHRRSAGPPRWRSPVPR